MGKMNDIIKAYVKHEQNHKVAMILSEFINNPQCVKDFSAIISRIKMFEILYGVSIIDALKKIEEKPDHGC